MVERRDESETVEEWLEALDTSSLLGDLTFYTREVRTLIQGICWDLNITAIRCLVVDFSFFIDSLRFFDSLARFQHHRRPSISTPLSLHYSLSFPPLCCQIQWRAQILLQAILSIGGSVISVVKGLTDRYLTPLRSFSLTSEEDEEGLGLKSDPNVRVGIR
jgi:hypothetical protein